MFRNSLVVESENPHLATLNAQHRMSHLSDISWPSSAVNIELQLNEMPGGARPCTPVAGYPAPVCICEQEGAPGEPDGGLCPFCVD